VAYTHSLLPCRAAAHIYTFSSFAPDGVEKTDQYEEARKCEETKRASQGKENGRRMSERLSLSLSLSVG
jgi:hypothetical protein